MNFDKVLMYVTIQEYTHQDLGNLIHIMLTSYHPWYPVYINDLLQGKATFQEVDEVDNHLYDYLHKINAAKTNLDHIYNERDME